MQQQDRVVVRAGGGDNGKELLYCGKGWNSKCCSGRSNGNAARGAMQTVKEVSCHDDQSNFKLFWIGQSLRHLI